MGMKREENWSSGGKGSSGRKGEKKTGRVG